MRNKFILLSAFLFIQLPFATSHATDSYTNLIMGYRDGFFAKTEDDRFGIKIGSRLNFGYTYGFVSGENLSSFDIQHAKFYIGGNAFGQTIQYYIQAAAANNTRRAGLGPLPETTNQGFILEDYYVRIQLEGMDLKAGQFKVPFARQWMIYSGNLDFVNRSAATQAFMFGRDRGVTLSRYTDSFSWSMGAFNGAGTIQTPNPFQLQTGQNISNDTAQKGMMYITRLAISPFGPLGYSEGDVEQTEGSKFEMGGTFAFDHHRDYDLNLNGTVDDSDVSTLNGAGDLTYKREGFSFQGEYFYRRHQASLVPNFTSHGFYAQPAYFVMPRKLELALRFSWLDPSGIVGNDQITETSGALNYYLSGDHRFKTQLQYTWLKRESITGNDDDSFLDLSLQVTI